MTRRRAFRLPELAFADATKGSLGGRLAHYCQKNNISVDELSSKFGVSRQTIYNWLCGLVDPKDEHKKAINSLLDND
jgi:transcriptional regulator with XRE-family HTH domain